MTRKELITKIIQSIETRDKSVFDAFTFDYIQHNLSFADGLQGMGSVLESIPAGSLKAKVCRTFEDGDFIFTHSLYDLKGEKAGFDIFRFENDLIVEHWDNFQDFAEPNKSNRTMLDGTTEIKDLDRTEENKAIATRLINEVFIKGGNTIGDYMDPNFLQHNPHGADGMEGMGVLMQYYNGSGNILRYDKVHKVFGEGNFVLVVGEGLYGLDGGVPTSFYDLFRFENGKVVEHWDVMEAILAEAERKNSNGKFNFPE